MAVISITITESTQQIISGIPKNISLSTNIPTTIFYTLDGTEPSTSSALYIGPITLPTNNSSVTLKLLATNGVDSAALTRTFGPSTGDARQPRDTVIGLPVGIGAKDNYPFGDNSQLNPVRYGRTGGITVDAPDIPNIPDGYDGTATGTFANGTDLPLTGYKFLYSETNNKGEFRHGVGTLPANTTIRVPPETSPQSSSKASSKFFNPRAMVIYQDSRNPPYDEVSQLNRAYFSLQRPDTTRDGALLLNTGFDGSTITGSFLKSHYNPTANTITYYYRDSDTNRWIISVEPYLPKNENIGALNQILFGRGSSKIFYWIPFMSRRLI